MGKSKESFAEIRTKSLYEITEQQQQFINYIEEADGELTPEMEQSLEISQSELNQKSVSYLVILKQKEASNILINNEIKRLQALKKRNDNITTRLNENLLRAVKTFGEFEVGLNKFSTRKSESVEVEFINELPGEFKVVKVTESADKVALKKAIKAGRKIEGVKLKQNQNLKIN